MRILVLSALFPPSVIGGAEVAAYDYTHWLADSGHEVALLTTAASREDEIVDGDLGGIRTWRLSWPRSYPIARFQTQPAWKKPLWHLQDHFDPRNRRLVAGVLDAFRPDFVNIHYLQGIGYDALAEIGRRDIPAMYVVNDLGLACIRMSMFKDGAACARQCASCRWSSRYKLRQVRKVARLGFWSPSQATLDRVDAFFPVRSFPNIAVVYPNKYARPTVSRTKSHQVRFVFVGRLHASKGVDVLLAAIAPLAEKYDFTLRIVGAGPASAELQRQYGQHRWLNFAGHVSQTEVADNLASADVLCVPSIWAEALGMVIVHALTLGVPVIASDVGGIPELVKPEENGLLVAAGDVEAWRSALERVLRNPDLLSSWGRYAGANADAFDQNSLGRRVLGFIEKIRAMRVERAARRARHATVAGRTDER